MNANAAGPVDLRWSVALEAPWAMSAAVTGISGGLALMLMGGFVLGRTTHGPKFRADADADVDAVEEPAPIDVDIAARMAAGAVVPVQAEASPGPMSARPAPDTEAPVEVDLRLLGAGAGAMTTIGSGGPDAPPREPGR
jgi:hypothetical protein